MTIADLEANLPGVDRIFGERLGGGGWQVAFMGEKDGRMYAATGFAPTLTAGER